MVWNGEKGGKSIMKPKLQNLPKTNLSATLWLQKPKESGEKEDLIIIIF